MRDWYHSKYHEGYRGAVSHSADDFDIIQETIGEFDPKLMIELGTFLYGFTLLLHEVNLSTPLYTFDRLKAQRIAISGRAKGMATPKDVEELRVVCFGPNVYFMIADVLKGLEGLTAVHLCKIEERKLLYCDNGDKVKEVSIYGRHLRVGDLLGIHDWGTEINYGDTEVLSQFDDHPVNQTLEDKGSLTRFFIKEREDEN